MFSWKPILVTVLCWIVSTGLAVGVSALIALTSDNHWERAFLQLLPSNLYLFYLLFVGFAAYLSYALGCQAGVRFQMYPPP